MQSIVIRMQSLSISWASAGTSSWKVALDMSVLRLVFGGIANSVKSLDVRNKGHVQHTIRLVEDHVLHLDIWRQHVVGSSSFNSVQSAYRRRHSTETELLRTTDFAHWTIDRGEATMLIALDISAAFDMVVHFTLLHRLSYSFGIDDAALRWIKSYLSERSQFVRIGTGSSKPTVCDCRVPQGSVLGPVLFTLYTSPVAKVADEYGVVQQQYADDTQLHIAMSKMSSANAIVQLQNCVTALHQWFAENGLALNPDKTEAIPFSTSQRAKGLSVISTIDAAGSTVPLSGKIKLRGVTLDGNLNFNNQVRNVCIASFSTFVRYVIFVSLSLKRWLTLLLVLLFSNESTMLIHCIQECHLLILTNCSWRRTHLHALLLSPANGTTSSRRSRENTGYFKVALLTYSIRHSGEPQHLNSLLMDYKPTGSLRSAEGHLLVVPRT